MRYFVLLLCVALTLALVGSESTRTSFSNFKAMAKYCTDRAAAVSRVTQRSQLKCKPKAKDLHDHPTTARDKSAVCRYHVLKKTTKEMKKISHMCPFVHFGKNGEVHIDAKAKAKAQHAFHVQHHVHTHTHHHLHIHEETKKHTPCWMKGLPSGCHGSSYSARQHHREQRAAKRAKKHEKAVLHRQTRHAIHRLERKKEHKIHELHKQARMEKHAIVHHIKRKMHKIAKKLAQVGKVSHHKAMLRRKAHLKVAHIHKKLAAVHAATLPKIAKKVIIAHLKAKLHVAKKELKKRQGHMVAPSVLHPVHICVRWAARLNADKHGSRHKHCTKSITVSPVGIRDSVLNSAWGKKHKSCVTWVRNSLGEKKCVKHGKWTTSGHSKTFIKKLRASFVKKIRHALASSIVHFQHKQRKQEHALLKQKLHDLHHEEKKEVRAVSHNHAAHRLEKHLAQRLHAKAKHLHAEAKHAEHKMARHEIHKKKEYAKHTHHKQKKLHKKILHAARKQQAKSRHTRHAVERQHREAERHQHECKVNAHKRLGKLKTMMAHCKDKARLARIRKLIGSTEKELHHCDTSFEQELAGRLAHLKQSTKHF